MIDDPLPHSEQNPVQPLPPHFHAVIFLLLGITLCAHDKHRRLSGRSKFHNMYTIFIYKHIYICTETHTVTHTVTHTHKKMQTQIQQQKHTHKTQNKTLRWAIKKRKRARKKHYAHATSIPTFGETHARMLYSAPPPRPSVAPCPRKSVGIFSLRATHTFHICVLYRCIWMMYLCVCLLCSFFCWSYCTAGWYAADADDVQQVVRHQRGIFRPVGRQQLYTKSNEMISLRDLSSRSLRWEEKRSVELRLSRLEDDVNCVLLLLLVDVCVSHMLQLENDAMCAIIKVLPDVNVDHELFQSSGGPVDLQYEGVSPF